MEEIVINAHSLKELLFFVEVVFERGDKLFLGLVDERSGGICRFIAYVSGVSGKLRYPVRILLHIRDCYPPYQSCDEEREKIVEKCLPIIAEQIRKKGYDITLGV